ncbi:MAG: excinuclease ABC subunit A, partial [Gammaproteobacteria bacterium]
MPKKCISIKGAQQNNLKNLDIDIPLNELVVITGVSGSGKSSLAFDTVYAEGQRRYVETFSPYARQFLDRMDKPGAERIDGITPAIAIDQTNPVRTSRSTVGTMTELNDHLKLLFARTTTLYCRSCGNKVQKDTPQTIYSDVAKHDAPYILITFEVTIPHNFSATEIKAILNKQGYTHIHRQTKKRIEVVQDRTRLHANNRQRIVEALETAIQHGHGKVTVHFLNEERKPIEARHYSAEFHCAQCDIDYQEPIPNSFSFNSPMGACDTCRGFGRTIGIDYDLVVPDANKT